MPCRFGGVRPYFVCPGIVNGIACGRRVLKLYGCGAAITNSPASMRCGTGCCHSTLYYLGKMAKSI
jgi:hypothetical protein